MSDFSTRQPVMFALFYGSEDEEVTFDGFYASLTAAEVEAQPYEDRGYFVKIYEMAEPSYSTKLNCDDGDSE